MYVKNLKKKLKLQNQKTNITGQQQRVQGQRDRGS